MRDVTDSAAAYPAVTPGKFWPDRVSAVLQSSEFTPVLPPPPPPVTPAPRTPAGAPLATQAAGPALATEAGAAAAPGAAAMPGSTGAPGRPGPDTAAGVALWRRGPRWLLPSLLGLAVAAGAGIAIALAVSPSPKPPTFLGTTASATVCTDPLGGCTDSGTASDMKVQPAEIILTADRSEVLRSLKWTGWGSPQASATGVVQAGGSPAVGATVTVSGLTAFGSGSGSQAYSSIIVKTATKNYSFTSHTVPG